MIRKDSGFTIIEILISGVLISFVLVAAFSVYTSGLNLFGKAMVTDIKRLPEVVVEDMARKINAANYVKIPNNGTKNFSLRMDSLNCNPSTPDPGGPMSTATDSWQHYSFFNKQLLGLCDSGVDYVSAPAPTLIGDGNPPGTVVLLGNLVRDDNDSYGIPACPPCTGSGGSGVLMYNPTYVLNPAGEYGDGSVIYIHLNSTDPAEELNTEVSWSAAKRRPAGMKN